MAKVSKTELAYAAGIIDGEGCVSIVPRRDRATYYGQIVVQMCLPEAVELLQSIFNGSLNIHKCNPPHRDQFCWQCVSRQAAACAEKLIPYLRVKKRQALALIELQDINQRIRADTTWQRAQRRGPLGHFGKYSVEPEWEARSRALYLLSRSLNARGVPVPVQVETENNLSLVMNQ